MYYNKHNYGKKASITKLNLPVYEVQIDNDKFIGCVTEHGFELIEGPYNKKSIDLQDLKLTIERTLKNNETQFILEPLSKPSMGICDFCNEETMVHPIDLGHRMSGFCACDHCDPEK